IVSEKTDVKKIMDKCVTGAFSYSGQICIHAQRFIVHKKQVEQFTQLMRKATLELKTGDPLKEDTKVSVMIDEENAKRVESWVNEAVKGGAKLVCGGKRKGSFYEATILTNTRKGQKVYDEEVFGPVITIESYEDSIDKAIKQLNDTKFGLQCGVFTDS